MAFLNSYYSIVFLTLTYIVFCLIVGFVHPKCIVDGVENPQCGEEGYDNTVLSWTSDFFVGVIFTFFAILLYLKTSKRILTSISFLLLSIVFIIQGFIGRYFGNSGLDDGKGQIGFYILMFITYVFWTVSALPIAYLVQTALDKINDDGGLQCGLFETRILFSFMVLSFIIVTTGCIWSSLALWDTTNDVIDDYPKDTNEGNIGIDIFKYGQLLWHGFYCTFLISTAYTWKALAKCMGVTIGGLPASYALGGIVISQIIIISILIGLALDGGDNANSNSFVSIMYNYAMLMTGYFIQSFFMSLFPIVVVEKDPEDTDNDNANSNSYVSITYNYVMLMTGYFIQSFMSLFSIVVYEKDPEDTDNDDDDDTDDDDDVEDPKTISQGELYHKEQIKESLTSQIQDEGVEFSETWFINSRQQHDKGDEKAEGEEEAGAAGATTSTNK